jgi:hypothetical protein
MTPWRRLLLVAVVVTVVLYVGGKVAWSQAAGSLAGLIIVLTIGFLSNFFAAPFGQILTRWVDTGSLFSALPTGAPENDTAALPPPVRSEPVTALIVAGVSFYALLLSNLALATLLASLDQLEHAKMLAFTDVGYAEAQKYFVGLLFLVIGFPATTAICVVLAGSRRPLPFRAFGVGIAISLPAYFLVAHAVGLLTSLGDTSALYTAFGSHLPYTPGYSGFEMLARLIQFAMLVVVWLALSVYTWAVANLSRAAIGLIQRVYRTLIRDRQLRVGP